MIILRQAQDEWNLFMMKLNRHCEPRRTIA